MEGSTESFSQFAQALSEALWDLSSRFIPEPWGVDLENSWGRCSLPWDGWPEMNQGRVEVEPRCLWPQLPYLGMAPAGTLREGGSEIGLGLSGSAGAEMGRGRVGF